jgi:hypothetical protein
LAISEVPIPEQPQPIDDAAGEVVEAGSAIGLADVRVHQADLPGLVDDVLRPGAVLVVLPGDLADLFLGEAVGQLAQILLFIGQGEVNHRLALLFVGAFKARAWERPYHGRSTD